MQIMLIDNSEKELNLLKVALSKGYSRFRNVYKDASLPDLIDIQELLLKDYRESDVEKRSDEIVQSTDGIPTYFVVDLFLTEKEHDKSYDRKDTVESHSGYKLAERIFEKKHNGCKISMMSKQFPGENRKGAKFGRLIEKPIYKGLSALNPQLMSSEIVSNPNMCSEEYGLPKSLDTFKVMEVFQNIVFFNAFNE
ncbi:hypothetical protein [Anaerocaecibacter muris]|uniref:hypothetical protein n=1 Tax=Anaerocaecibacter muris TaxID=2941513 RepID=UPI003F694580